MLPSIESLRRFTASLVEHELAVEHVIVPALEQHGLPARRAWLDTCRSRARAVAA